MILVIESQNCLSSESPFKIKFNHELILPSIVCTGNLSSSKMQVHISEEFVWCHRWPKCSTAVNLWRMYKGICWVFWLPNSLIDHLLPPLSSKPLLLPHLLPYQSNPANLSSGALQTWHLFSVLFPVQLFHLLKLQHLLMAKAAPVLFFDRTCVAKLSFSLHCMLQHLKKSLTYSLKKHLSQQVSAICSS